MKSMLKAQLSFCLDFSRALMESGCPSHRIEYFLTRLENAWNIQIKALAVPTSITISVQDDIDFMMDFERVKDWRVNLSFINDASLLIDQIYIDQLDHSKAKLELEKLIVSNQGYKPSVILVAKTLTSATLAYFYLGNTAEIATAATLGLITAALQHYLLASDLTRYLADFLSAVVITLIAFSVGQVITIDTGKVITAGIVTLVPGLVFVNALNELAVKNLVSGTARMMEALMIGLSLAFGVFIVAAAFKYIGEYGWNF